MANGNPLQISQGLRGLAIGLAGIALVLTIASNATPNWIKTSTEGELRNLPQIHIGLWKICTKISAGKLCISIEALSRLKGGVINKPDWYMACRALAIVTNLAFIPFILLTIMSFAKEPDSLKWMQIAGVSLCIPVVSGVITVAVFIADMKGGSYWSYDFGFYLWWIGIALAAAAPAKVVLINLCCRRNLRGSVV